MEKYHVYRIFEGNFADDANWKASNSYSYCTTMRDGSPVSVVFTDIVEPSGDAVVKWTFDSLEDMNAFITYARSGNTDPAIVGSPEGRFPGREFTI